MLYSNINNENEDNPKLTKGKHLNKHLIIIFHTKKIFILKLELKNVFIQTKKC